MTNGGNKTGQAMKKNFSSQKNHCSCYTPIINDWLYVNTTLYKYVTPGYP